MPRKENDVMIDYEFKSIHIDLENNIFEINGESFQDLPIVNFELVFDDYWKLKFTQECIGAIKKFKEECV